MAQTWRLEEAKARFSELVRLAKAEGPQAVSVRGRRAVVIMDAEAFDDLARPAPRETLTSFLQTLGLDELALDREPDPGRDTLL